MKKYFFALFALVFIGAIAAEDPAPTKYEPSHPPVFKELEELEKFAKSAPKGGEVRQLRLNGQPVWAVFRYHRYSPFACELLFYSFEYGPYHPTLQSGKYVSFQSTPITFNEYHLTQNGEQIDISLYARNEKSFLKVATLYRVPETSLF